jgi:hypothetical protein
MYQTRCTIAALSSGAELFISSFFHLFIPFIKFIFFIIFILSFNIFHIVTKCAEMFFRLIN